MEQLPLDLADLHRTTPVGAIVELKLSRRDWPEQRAADVVIGAGFEIVEVTRAARHILVRAVRARSLADTVGSPMRLLVCGLNPSLYAADAGVAFARPGNRFWPAMLRAGLVSRDRDARHALVVHGVGLTDLVKRATARSSELTVDEYRAGFERVERLAAWLQPGVVVFAGLEGWRVATGERKAGAGPASRSVGGRPAYLLPSPSGANAHAQLPDLVSHLKQLNQ